MLIINFPSHLIARRNQIARNETLMNEITEEAVATAKGLLLYGSKTTAGNLARSLAITKLKKAISNLAGYKKPTKQCEALIRDLIAKGAYPYPYAKFHHNPEYQERLVQNMEPPKLMVEFERLITDAIRMFPVDPFNLTIEETKIAINVLVSIKAYIKEHQQHPTPTQAAEQDRIYQLIVNYSAPMGSA
jgi:hypothetical protein